MILSSTQFQEQDSLQPARHGCAFAFKIRAIFEAGEYVKISLLTCSVYDLTLVSKSCLLV